MLLVPATLRADGWTDVRQVGDFRIRANFSLDQYPQLIPELQQLERDVTELLQVKSRGKPVHLLLFADRASYQRYLDQYFQGAPRRRALFIKGSQPGWVLAYVNDRFDEDVRHETTHALLHSRLPHVPLWLDEGIAEYLEVRADQRLRHHPHRSSVVWSTRLYRAAELAELERLGDVRQMGREEYRWAWAWVHFMIHGPPAARRVLVAYLSDLAEERPPGRLSERLPQAVPDLKSAFLRHHRGW